jgi:hypothetical protein
MRILTLAVALMLPAVAACDDDDESGPATEFSADLAGDEEVPPVLTTDATGSADLSIDDDQITYTVNVNGLENAVVAHIHVAPEGENGPVRLNLCGTGAPEPPCASGDGVLATGTNGAVIGISFDSLVSAMRTGGAYVNVHTDDGEGAPNTGPGDLASGEIRGQIVAE